jgi:hypothetical protein
MTTALIGFYRRYTHTLNTLLLTVLTCAVFSSCLNIYFLSPDDFNWHVHPTSSLMGAFTLTTFGTTGWGNYRPLETVSHMVDMYLYGDGNYAGRHLTSLVLHAANVLLVYALAHHLTRASAVSFTAAILFAVHPLHSAALPPVAWISDRPNLVVTFFYLLALLLFFIFHAKRSYYVYSVSLLAFALAMFTKEMAVTLPLAIALYVITLSSGPFEAKRDGFLSRHRVGIWRTLLGLGTLSLSLGLIFNVGFISNHLSPDGVLEPATIKTIHLLQILALGSSLLSILLGLSVRFEARHQKALWILRHCLPYLGIIFVYLLLRILIGGGLGGPYQAGGQSVFFNLGSDAFARDILSLVGLIWPVSSGFQGFVFMLQFDRPILFYSLSLMTGFVVIALFIYCLRTSRTLIFVFLWTLISLIPVHNILITPWDYNSRLLYLPAVGTSIMLSVILYRLAGSGHRWGTWARYCTVVSVIVVVITFCFLIRARNEKVAQAGDITRNLVQTIQAYQTHEPEEAEWGFVTFPLSSIDHGPVPVAYAYMDQLRQEAQVANVDVCSRWRSYGG